MLWVWGDYPNVIEDDNHIGFMAHQCLEDGAVIYNVHPIGQGSRFDAVFDGRWISISEYTPDPNTISVFDCWLDGGRLPNLQPEHSDSGESA